MAEIAAGPLAGAARDLMLAGRWDHAAALLSRTRRRTRPSGRCSP